MPSNSFGNVFRITTWGESHGKAIGVVIDGCPAGLALSEEDINQKLSFRAPGKTPYTSPRKEPDIAEILSGVFEGKTTGAPISILIVNRDIDSTQYSPIKDILRPGHASYVYLEKYGIFDYRGGGRASARETACRVAAGSVAQKLLDIHEIKLIAYLKQLGDISLESLPSNFEELKQETQNSPLFCPEKKTANAMLKKIEELKIEGDSVGGIVEAMLPFLPAGIGDPIYEKLEANLASAMLSIPACKGFEIGSGFEAAKRKGSENNDAFILNSQGQIQTATNNCGGILAGISTGMPITFQVGFKPTSSILKAQTTLTTDKKSVTFTLPEGSRHDPCVAIRAVPVVEAMAALVIADALLMHRLSRL